MKRYVTHFDVLTLIRIKEAHYDAVRGFFRLMMIHRYILGLKNRADDEVKIKVRQFLKPWESKDRAIKVSLQIFSNTKILYFLLLTRLYI